MLLALHSKLKSNSWVDLNLSRLSPSRLLRVYYLDLLVVEYHLDIPKLSSENQVQQLSTHISGTLFEALTRDPFERTYVSKNQ